MKEFADFLAAHDPYDALDKDDLQALALRVEVEFFSRGTVIVSADGSALDHMWVVRSGAVDIIDRGRVIDQLGPGETFGHISVLTDLPPAMSARAAEDTLCLRLPDPRRVVENPELLRFSHFGTLISRERVTGRGSLDREIGSVARIMRPVLLSAVNETVAETARRMTAEGHSCAVVPSEAGLGIVTDRDFREHVASGEISPSAPIVRIANFPALAASDDFSQAAAFSRMLDRGVHHLLVMRQGQPIGVVRAVDFASADIRSPLLIRTSIESASDIGALAEAAQLLRPTLVELSQQEVAPTEIGNLFAAVVDATLRKILDLRNHSGLVPSWVVLGSMARREPLPASDVDTALVWEQQDATPNDVEVLREEAESVLKDMERCGLPRCTNGANAVNPLFSRSRADWLRATDDWLRTPDAKSALLLSSITIDSRPLTELTLGRTITESLRQRPREPAFLHAFMRESLAVTPPTGFVRNFVVHQSGEHRGQLDLKRGGLLPIVAIGRLISAAIGDPRGSTIDRLRRGQDAHLLSANEADTLIGAFEQIYELTLRREVSALRSGNAVSSYVVPKELDTLNRRHLRESFRSIAFVQESLSVSLTSRIRR